MKQLELVHLPLHQVPLPHQLQLWIELKAQHRDTIQIQLHSHRHQLHLLPVSLVQDDAYVRIAAR